MRSRSELILMVVAAAVFVLSTMAMAFGQEPFATWYYSFAWWSYIIFVDAGLGIRRPCGTVLRNTNVLRLLGLSIVIWVSFEVYNFRLANWYYLELPAERVVRWCGYTMAYATVLPGIFVTWRGLERLFPVTTEVPQYRRVFAKMPSVLLWGGLAASLLPWIWPRHFFPLVWLGPTAFFAAMNYRWGGPGLLKTVQVKGPSTLFRLIAAGGVCGLLWEFWNFWAKSKWTYDIPFFDWLHVFEMPIAGFVGFLPFAVECHEMYWVGSKALDRLKKRGRVYWGVLALMVVYVLLVYWGIDEFTVRTYQ